MIRVWDAVNDDVASYNLALVILGICYYFVFFYVVTTVTNQGKGHVVLLDVFNLLTTLGDSASVTLFSVAPATLCGPALYILLWCCNSLFLLGIFVEDSFQVPDGDNMLLFVCDRGGNKLTECH